jgi:hypothetical protein
MCIYITYDNIFIVDAAAVDNARSVHCSLFYCFIVGFYFLQRYTVAYIFRFSNCLVLLTPLLKVSIYICLCIPICTGSRHISATLRYWAGTVWWANGGWR